MSEDVQMALEGLSLNVLVALRAGADPDEVRDTVDEVIGTYEDEAEAREDRP